MRNTKKKKNPYKQKSTKKFHANKKKNHAQHKKRFHVQPKNSMHNTKKFHTNTKKNFMPNRKIFIPTPKKFYSKNFHTHESNTHENFHAHKIVRDRALDPFFQDVGLNPHEWVESCYCLSKWRFDQLYFPLQIKGFATYLIIGINKKTEIEKYLILLICNLIYINHRKITWLSSQIQSKIKYIALFPSYNLKIENYMDKHLIY